MNLSPCPYWGAGEEATGMGEVAAKELWANMLTMCNTDDYDRKLQITEAIIKEFKEKQSCQ